MTRTTGSCHCGNLSYALEWPDGEEMHFRRCSCSYCTRLGSIFTAHPRAALSGQVRDDTALRRYTFATRTAEFFVCARCGVVPWVTSVIDGKIYAAVNANTFDVPPRASASPLRSYDGEAVEDRLARRRRSWIATVEIALEGGPAPELAR